MITRRPEAKLGSTCLFGEYSCEAGSLKNRRRNLSRDWVIEECKVFALVALVQLLARAHDTHLAAEVLFHTSR